MSARTKQAMRFCTGHRGKSPIACLLEPCTIRARLCAQQTLYLTETREAGHRRRMSCMRLFLHNCLSIRRLNTSAPHTVTALSALQAPRTCSVHNCASGTSRMLRPPFVNNDFHEQGMDFRPLRDKKKTAAGGCVSLQIHRQSCTSHKSGQGTNREKNGEHLPALPRKTSGAVGAKRKTTPLRRPCTDRRTCLVSTQICTSKRVRDNTMT